MPLRDFAIRGQVHHRQGRTSWAWFDIAKVRASLQDPEASIEDALARAIHLNPSEPQFHEWQQQHAKQK